MNKDGVAGRLPLLQQAQEDMLEVTGVRHRIFPSGSVEGSRNVVMRGRFAFRNHGGLSVHCGHGVETRNLSSMAELPPGLSFNLLFRGSVDFSLGGRRYRLGARDLSPVECSGFALSRPEMMTRFTRSGAYVDKLNIFVQQSWLQQRCQSEAGTVQVQRLFARHAIPHFWAADAETESLARRLMALDAAQSFSEQLQQEQLAIELLSRCVDAFDAQLLAGDVRPAALPGASDFLLKQRVDEKLRDCRGLEEIASALGVSVSTLQRKFKALYGTTVIDYVRRRRLEIARAALIMDGLSIGEAAYLAGYNHASNFVAAFKKAFQVTPAQLVRSHRRSRKFEPG